MEREKGKGGERARGRGERNPTGYQRSPTHRWVHYGPLCPERKTKLSWRHKRILANPPGLRKLGTALPQGSIRRNARRSAPGLTSLRVPPGEKVATGASLKPLSGKWVLVRMHCERRHPFRNQAGTGSSVAVLTGERNKAKLNAPQVETPPAINTGFGAAGGGCPDPARSVHEGWQFQGSRQ